MKKKIMLISLALIAVIYIAGVVAFNNRIVPNTNVGDIKLSMVKFDGLKDLVDSEFKSETLKISDVVIEDYEASVTDLGASIDSDKLASDIKQYQNAFIWPLEIAAKSDFELKDYITVDSDALEQKLTTDGFFNEDDRIKAEPATLELNPDTSNYEVVEATEGTIIDQDLLIEQVSKALYSLKPSIDSSKSYHVAKNNVSELGEQADALNQRINRNVSMEIGEDAIDVPKDIVAEALYINDDGVVDIDGTGIYSYLYDASLSYDSAEVGFGYRTVTESNVDPAYEEIKAGLLADENVDVVGVAPIDDQEDTFKPTKKTDEKTYIEINISHQVMWVFKGGELLVQTPVVTGSQADGWDTPVGTYSVIDKETDKVLNGSSVGFDYEVPVNYWMRLTNSGIGIHDIDWLNSGNAWDSRQVYELQGSHGCINVPNDVMATVYNNIPVGTPVYVTP